MQRMHVQQHLLAAQALIQARNLQGAIARCRDALALEPDNAQAFALIGACQLELGLTKEARKTAEEGLAAAPDFVPLHRVLGLAAAARNEFGLANHHLREAVRLNPTDANSHVTLAQFLSRDGTREESIKSLERALSLAPDNVNVLSMIAATNLNLNRLDQAERFARRAYELAPCNPNVLVTNGVLELRRGRVESAEEFAYLAAGVGALTQPTLELFAAAQMARSVWLRPLWVAVQGLQRIGAMGRVALLYALTVAAPLGFILPPAPFNLIAGWTALGGYCLVVLCLFGSSFIIRRMVALRSRAARIKREF